MVGYLDTFAHARPNWLLKTDDLSSSLADSTPPLATTAPVLQCYEEAVQEPLLECSNLDSLYTQVQLDDSDRFDAKILREDFCSTAIVATTWLALDKKNLSQGVDIDLNALADTQRRLGDNKVRLLQSPNFAKRNANQTIGTIELNSLDHSNAPKLDAESASSTPGPLGNTTPSRESTSDTWAPGAATERFDRKLAKKLQKEAQKASKKIKSKKTEAGQQQAAPKGDAPRMTLLHSDVLDLPIPAPGSDSSKPSSALEPPDIVASLNYAMAYFHDRKTLVEYFRMALRTLRPKTGVFITDMFGGPSTGELYPDQDETWNRFKDEFGFGRDDGDGRKQVVLAADSKQFASAVELVRIGDAESRPGRSSSEAVPEEETVERVLEVMPAPKPGQSGTRAEWPRGKLKLVRKGTAHGGFEYWREDGPVDWMTNRFRMSLSFRFSDGSWLRDVFWYDFRVWSIKELTEAMEEAGFVRVKVFVLPRNAGDDELRSVDDSDDSRPSSPEPSEAGDERGGLENMANLLRRTEKEEKIKAFYRSLDKGEKLFANRSFGTYLVACAP